MANNPGFQHQRPQPNLAQVRSARSQQNGARIHSANPPGEENSANPAPKR
jgi:hypothetical protein